MKYSRNLVIALMGSSQFPESKVSYFRKKYFLNIPNDLDVFDTLLFFFCFEPRFTPSKFLKFFAHIEKVSDLKHKSTNFESAIKNSLDKISKIKIRGISCFESLKDDPYFTYRFQFSKEALDLQILFVCEIQGSDFWISNRKLGISNALIGSLMYLSGICGSTRINFNSLSKNTLFQSFEQFNSSKPSFLNYRLIRSFLDKFLEAKVFHRSKYIPDFKNNILPINPIVSKSGITYESHTPTFYTYKNIWKNGKPAGRIKIAKDFLEDRYRQEQSVSKLNELNMDIRFNGTYLPNQISIDYLDDHMSKVNLFKCPVSHIQKKYWKDITFGKEECSIIEIEHIRTLYLNSCLKRQKSEIKYSTPLIDRVPASKHEFMTDLALTSIFQYGNDNKKCRQHFRTNLLRYLKIYANKHEINSFFYYLTDKKFQIQNRTKKYFSQGMFEKQSFQTYFEAVLRLPNHTSMIVTEYGIIVPKSQEKAALEALSLSYKETFGDRRLATFKIIDKQGIRKFKYTNSGIREVEND